MDFATVFSIIVITAAALLAPLLWRITHVRTSTDGSKPLISAACSQSKVPDAAFETSAAGEAPAPPPQLVGYNPAVEQLRQQEFKRLQDRVYADYAGAAPYSEKLLAEVLQELSSSLHGNPHSEAGWGECRSAAADAARLATLRMCNADPEQYACIFTAGATAALKLVGESFPWSPASTFLYLRDNHNSVLGIRQLASQHGATCSAAVELKSAGGGCGGGTEGCEWQLTPCSEAAAAGLEAAAAASMADASGAASPAEHLFAFPLESNFSGVRYDPGLVAAVQSGRLRYSRAVGSDHTARCSAGVATAAAAGADRHASGGVPLPAGRWWVMLDCAKACGTTPPDLAACPADFAVLSYYKIFGYPTGLGALVARKDALGCLRRRYFGGGTVAVSLADEPFHSLRPGPAGWEDGTTSFLDFPAVNAGMRFIQRLGGFPSVAAHAGAVAASLACQLSSLRHSNGAPVCMLYSTHAEAEQHAPPEAQQEPEVQQQQPHQQQCSRQLHGSGAAPAGVVGQGPVVAFNLLRPDGSFVGYREVEKLASLSGIHLRTGCLCNPGACAAALGFAASDMRANFEAGHVCWDDHDVIGGQPTGVVRASFGYASSLADAAAVAALVRRFFVAQGPEADAAAGAGFEAPQQEAEGRGRALRKRGAAAEMAAAAATGVSADAALAPSTPTAAANEATAGAAVARALSAEAEAAQAMTAGLVCLGGGVTGSTSSGSIQSLWVHPIKSCRGFSPQAWPLGPGGLLYDRCWALVDCSSGAALRLRKHPRLATISARVDLARGLLLVTAPGEPSELQVLLPGAALAVSQPQAAEEAASDGSSSGHDAKLQGASCSVSLCTRSACAQRAGTAAGGEAEAAAWFSRVLGIPCRLVQQAAPDLHPSAAQQAALGAPESGQGQVAGLGSTSSSSLSGEASRSSGSARRGSSWGPGGSFANDGQLLVVGAASLKDLASRSASSENPEVFVQRFRPNLVVSGMPAYAEDSWRQLSIAASNSISAPAAASAASAHPPLFVQLDSAGPCTRCDMICADPLTGRHTGPEPLLTLAGYRRSRGRITFGLLMNRCQERQQPAGPQPQRNVARRAAGQSEEQAAACTPGGARQQADEQAAPSPEEAAARLSAASDSMAWLAMGMRVSPVL